MLKVKKKREYKFLEDSCLFVKGEERNHHRSSAEDFPHFKSDWKFTNFTGVDLAEFELSITISFFGGTLYAC